MRGLRLRIRRPLCLAIAGICWAAIVWMDPSSAGELTNTDNPYVNTGLDGDGGNVEVEISNPGDSNSTPGSGTPTDDTGGSPYACGLITLAQGLAGDYTAGVGVPDPPEGHSWYIDTCGGLLVAVPDPPPVVPTGPTQTDIDGLIAQARARVEPPRLTIGTSPPLDPGAVVGISTWYWVDAGNWTTQRSTASSTQWNLHVTVIAEPLRLRFNPGDHAAPGGGQTINCVGPAPAWNRSLSDDDSDCIYTYDYPSSITPAGTFTVTAEVDWRLTYVVTGLINQAGTIGTITLASPPRNLPVTELQAVISN